MLSRLFKKRKKVTSASIAKERLQIIVAHERNKNMDGQPDFLLALQQDILEVVRKYISINSDQIKVAMDKEDGCDVLELNIVLLDQDESGKPVAQNVESEDLSPSDEQKQEA